MNEPAQLIAFYVTKAFQTRLAALALTMVIAGVALERSDTTHVTEIAAVMLILMPATLGALNHRYTYSHACACAAAAWENVNDDPHSRGSVSRWNKYRELNEAWWKQDGSSSGVATVVRRFCLSWLTFVSPLVFGVWLAFTSDLPWFGRSVLAAALSIVVVWIYLAEKGYHPESMIEVGAGKP